MTSNYELDLCRIDGLTDDQLAGIDSLGATTDAEVAAFVETFEAAWEANRQAVSDSIEAISQAIVTYQRVETEIVAEVRLRRRPKFSPVEQAACDEALAAYRAALETHEAAKARFKAGVTPEQLEA